MEHCLWQKNRRLVRTLAHAAASTGPALSFHVPSLEVFPHLLEVFLRCRQLRETDRSPSGPHLDRRAGRVRSACVGRRKHVAGAGQWRRLPLESSEEVTLAARGAAHPDGPGGCFPLPRRRCSGGILSRWLAVMVGRHIAQVLARGHGRTGRARPLLGPAPSSPSSALLSADRVRARQTLQHASS